MRRLHKRFYHTFGWILYYLVILIVVGNVVVMEEEQLFKNNEDSQNYNVSVIYNTTLKKLQYIISWEDISPNAQYKVELFSDGENEFCGTDLIVLETNDTNAYLPDKRDHHYLYGNCTYWIEVTANGEYVIRPTPFFMPLCVDGKCDCVSAAPQIDQLTGQRIDSFFLVEWTYDSDPSLNNITKTYFRTLTDCSDEEHFNQIYPLEEKPTSAVFDKSFFLRTDTCLVVLLENNYTCETSSWIDIVEFQLPDDDKGDPLVNISTIVLVILLVLVISYWYIDKFRGTIKGLFRRTLVNRNDRRNQNNNNLLGRCQIEVNSTYIPTEFYEGKTDNFELPRGAVTLHNVIGKGAFGEVYFGKVKLNGVQVPVAVKTLRARAPPEEKDDFRAEIEIMKKIGKHENIVKMFCCCTLNEPYMMVMEYLPFGDLRKHLHGLRDQWYIRKNYYQQSGASHGSAAYVSPDSPGAFSKRLSNGTDCTNVTITPTSMTRFTFDVENALNHTELQNFALQIAKGMAHLEKIPITHRDLAARNILINERKELKISDFGLSRAGPYVNHSQKKLPLRWMALEAIEKHCYDNKSDVWSFAVVLWEIGTLGAFPYEQVPDRMLHYYLKMGKRLERPAICTDELYQTMLRCWSADSDLRPSFEELVDELDANRSSVYVDFGQLNPLYVFPPTSQRDNQGSTSTSTSHSFETVIAAAASTSLTTGAVIEEVASKSNYIECVGSDRGAVSSDG